jgi:hypothetical protein
MYLKVKVLRALTRRPFGIAKFRSRGKTIFSKIVRFDVDTIKTRNGVYLFDRNKVYIEKDGKRDKEFDISSNSEMDTGVPVIYFDLEDMIPLNFVPEAPDSIKGSRNPFQAQATLKKEIALAEAETISKVKSKQDKLLKIAIILVIVVAGISFFEIQTLLNISNMLAARPP